jgi:hypothetical protein
MEGKEAKIEFERIGVQSVRRLASVSWCRHKGLEKREQTSYSGSKYKRREE